MRQQDRGDESSWRRRKLMKKSSLLFFGCAVMVLVATPLYGQTGCTDSPENPTVVLALVGGAGALFSAVRSRMRARGRRASKGLES
jgi:XrtJ-associated TM-motif-TM protein